MISRFKETLTHACVMSYPQTDNTPYSSLSLIICEQTTRPPSFSYSERHILFCGYATTISLRLYERGIMYLTP